MRKPSPEEKALVREESDIKKQSFAMVALQQKENLRISLCIMHLISHYAFNYALRIKNYELNIEEQSLWQNL